MSSLASLVELARENRDPAPLIAAIPYAGQLGIACVYQAGGEPLFHLPPLPRNIGNPTLPALHGGAIGGFMEMSATLHLLLTMETLRVPKVVDFSIDYVRAGRFLDTYAACRVVRQGRKLANVVIHAWQQEREALIATARAHFVLD